MLVDITLRKTVLETFRAALPDDFDFTDGDLEQRLMTLDPETNFPSSGEEIVDVCFDGVRRVY